jgi:uncharacterized protein (DUF924 family)
MGDTALIEKNWASDVLSFWFGELKPDDWFERKDAIDEAIRDRFGELYQSLSEAAPSMSFDDPETALAAILVFDQFPRNMFRGDSRAFVTDNDQERCVSLTSALAGDTVKYAIRHRDIVARFGRFPHRNQALGRQSTEAEQLFLSDHKGFGQ